jgi:hypothetical protein
MGVGIGKCTAYRSGANRTEQDAVDLRFPGDLSARNKWQQGPVSAGEHEEGCCADQGCTKRSVISRVSQTRANGIEEALWRQTSAAAARLASP